MLFRSINYSSASIRLVQGIQHRLRSLGVVSTITPTETPAGEPCWVLNVSTPDVHALGGFNLRHSRKAGIMKAFLAGPSPETKGAYSRFRLMPLPVSLAKELRSVIGVKAARQVYNLVNDSLRPDRGHVSKESAKRILDYLDEAKLHCEHPLFEAWKAIALAPDVHFEKVVEVNKTGIKETGHDLTVPGYETFTSVDGIVLSNTMAIHVPASDEARDEIASKMMPSRQLLNTSQFKAHFLPRQEFALGLWQASQPSKRRSAARFKSIAEAMAAFRRGELNMDSVVDVPNEGPTNDVLSMVQRIRT